MEGGYGVAPPHGRMQTDGSQRCINQHYKPRGKLVSPLAVGILVKPTWLSRKAGSKWNSYVDNAVADVHRSCGLFGFGALSAKIWQLFLQTAEIHFITVESQFLENIRVVSMEKFWLVGEGDTGGLPRLGSKQKILPTLSFVKRIGKVFSQKFSRPSVCDTLVCLSILI